MRNRWLLIGTVLGLVLFVASRALFHFVPGSHEAAAKLSRNAPYFLCALCVPLALYYLPRYRRSAVHNVEGLRLMAEGRVVAALQQFEAALPLAKSDVIPTYNIAVCQLQLWRLPDAERALGRLETRKDLTPQFRAVLCAALALAAAMQGRSKPAEQWLDAVRKWGHKPFSLAVLASAVVACRAGLWSEAREQLGQPVAQELTGPLRGLRQALGAWCQEQLTGEPRPVDAVAVFGEASPDALQAAWPELVAFLLERSRQPPVRLSAPSTGR
ncbi:hypothetical protein [Corallococcus llansteffanensis]|uniref:Tetratricopeptide repeat protein n=1 Tax=Corallococcus llansteffanensis TaxID=2316731 RepID=A0A3A8PSV4_9BACT|nr:hypothetical protein [Corallococcus llansteffanensis]RKH59537.1 hypothetical protein D7V93_14765 [Corallococcus llansteffanensis]